MLVIERDFVLSVKKCTVANFSVIIWLKVPSLQKKFVIEHMSFPNIIRRPFKPTFITTHSRH